MSENERQNISETFGRFTESSSIGGQHNMNGPRNVTSDMWAPISVGRTAEPQSKVRQNTDAGVQKREEKPVSTEKKRPDANKSKAPVKSAQRPAEKGRNSEKNEKKPSKQTDRRKPKGKPVSDVIKKKLLSDERKKDAAKQQRQKQQQELDKNRQEYENQIKEGKSHIEISKKRAEIKRKKRRIRNILTVVIFFVFVAAFVGIYTYAKGAPIANIIIEGDSIYSNKKITQAAGVSVGVNMFSLREKTINDSVAAALPYIHSVEIDRDLPDTLKIKVTPTTEKFLIVNDTEYICVDEYMKILSLKKKKLKDGFFRIYGFEKQTVDVGTEYEPSDANKEKFRLVEDIIRELEKNEVIKSAVINVADMNDVRVLHNSKVMIYLGGCSELENQINLACNVIKDTVSEGQTGYIDMRYSNMAFFNEGTINAH